MKHLLSLEKLSGTDLRAILDRVAAFKRNRTTHARPLTGQTWALIFSKSSTRTRVSFEVGIRELGGTVLFLNANDIQLGRGEPIKDTARVLGRMLHGAVIRTFAQQDVEDFAEHAGIPTVNALTDDEHPCQILTDIFTFEEQRGVTITGRVVTFVGDAACNVPLSWIFAAARLGFELRLAAPKAYWPSPAILRRAGAGEAADWTRHAADTVTERMTIGAGTLELIQDVRLAARQADLLYTDVWVSMGKEAESAQRIRDLTGYQINAELVGLAKPGVLVMHCLPAYRGKEIDEATLEAHADTIFTEAENRLHTQKAILDWLVSESAPPLDATPGPGKVTVEMVTVPVPLPVAPSALAPAPAPAPVPAPAIPSAPSPAPAPAPRINLRRPDVMEAVAAQVVAHYRSELVERIRANGGRLSHGGLTIKLAKEFGFCYGVERAIDLAYAARRCFPEPTRIFLLGEIIHNPEVNDQIRNMGIVSVSPKPADDELARLHLGPQDVVIIPAFGTEVVTRRKIEALGCKTVDTTCGDVMSVWKRVRGYSKDGVTSIIHGKAKHEETKATTSQATANGTGHYLVVFDLGETDYVCDYICRGGDRAEFLERFKGACSPGFDPDQHLVAVGVANQTTMLRGETEEVQRRFRSAMERRYGAGEIDRHFRVFDTICGATQERQDALEKLLREPMDLLIVVGGYNSSNTSHLAEMGEKVLPTYFIKNAAMMESSAEIRHWNQHTAHETETKDWLPAGRPVTIGITAGASCPNNLIEDTIKRLFKLQGLDAADVLRS